MSKREQPTQKRYVAAHPKPAGYRKSGGHTDMQKGRLLLTILHRVARLGEQTSAALARTQPADRTRNRDWLYHLDRVNGAISRYRRLGGRLTRQTEVAHMASVEVAMREMREKRQREAEQKRLAKAAALSRQKRGEGSD